MWRLKPEYGDISVTTQPYAHAMDRSTKPSFNFVNLKHPDDLKDEETQLRIRRLAMTEVGKARRKPKTKRARNEIVLEFRDASERTPEISRLGGGALDPFGPYPIHLDDSARALVANIFDTNGNHPNHLRGTWYPVGLESEIAFLNMLANSQNFMFQKKNGFFPTQDDSVALAYHHKALRRANEMMKKTQTHNSEATISAIVSFMCHHALHGSFSGGEWHKHCGALSKIVSLRGGYDAVKTEHLRITISWADLLGSFFQDIQPMVPLPKKWEADSKSPPASPRRYSPISLAWKQQMPMQTGWVALFDDVVQLISLDRAFSEKQLALATASGCWLEPILWKLLSLRPLQHGNNREHVIEEVCRLGTLLFLAPVWRMMGQTPVWTAAISHNLLVVLMEHMTEWKELKDLLIWVLYFAAIETSDLGKRSHLVFMLAVLMGGMQIATWDDLMRTVKGVLWVERAFASSDELIRDEVLATVAQNALRPATADVAPAFLENLPGNVAD
ncbi:hypothetical protein FB567DRAFT_541528 [Paraphoma chrysanthemicola]|uniref:Tachykinin family protein n=1 Tax=Paraphoma chrysanthemicola TaxID=798071 RepID=A0A8K0QTL6_9PLEO|nr:hypothetical protein FB567DRAFT_541528 [Paraphoma chrysanthemicola]